MGSFTFLKSAGWAPWLPLLAVISIPFGRSVELFVLIMAVIGLFDLIKNHQNLRQSFGFKAFTLVFICFMLPALLSLPDAFDFKHSATSLIGMARFYFAGLFIINRITNYNIHLWLATGIGCVLAFWGVDAWWQQISGHDLLGLPPFSSGRISGIFSENAELGLMIIPFLGVAIAAFKERINVYAAMIFTLLSVSVILISGDRAAWVSLLATAVLWILLFRPKNFKFSKNHFFISISGIVLIAVAVFNTPQFQARLDKSLVGFSGNYESVNTASSFRLPIWNVALSMFADNPINGVGVRSFRYAYPDYAQPDDIFVDKALPREQQVGAYQPHQIVLEFLAEMGIIGIIGFMAAIWILFVKWYPVVRSQQSALASGYLISLMAILFPINSHLSSFSSSWAQVIWLLVALCVSAMVIEKRDDGIKDIKCDAAKSATAELKVGL
ncbi:O-antigen ligase family protein [Neptunomonas qingdaonensis]|uniref:O-antigen ligase n=1 Tax=Neptunomonas qingdaonensis TaxID=1045558 RepID=A0A1I2M1J3_9GAMM|nr:O-antigen ligase family protein [Neptunomonas qingdaonensis]SFF84559.1 O-antigen ligase [Neptunomonas qingdaonensis]